MKTDRIRKRDAIAVITKEIAWCRANKNYNGLLFEKAFIEGLKTAKWLLQHLQPSEK